jgi:hypothetical protein
MIAAPFAGAATAVDVLTAPTAPAASVAMRSVRILIPPFFHQARCIYEHAGLLVKERSRQPSLRPASAQSFVGTRTVRRLQSGRVADCHGSSESRRRASVMCACEHDMISCGSVRRTGAGHAFVLQSQLGPGSPSAVAEFVRSRMCLDLRVGLRIVNSTGSSPPT